MDDEFAAFTSELDALESAPPAAAAATGSAAFASATVPVPKVISAAPVRAAPPLPAGSLSLSEKVNPGFVKLPPSQWATPDELRAKLAAEGLPVPMGQAAPMAVPPPPPPKPAFIHEPTFEGARPGYVFKTDIQGTGYYLEGPAVEASGGGGFGAGLSASCVAAAVSAVSQFAEARGLGGFGDGGASSRGGSGGPSGGGGGGGGGPSGGAAAADAGAPGKRNITRTVGGQVWKDETLLEWPEDDFRIFVGDLGSEVSDEVLGHAFANYPSYQRSRVVKNGRTGKSMGYGFVSFHDPWDMTKALREMHGKYVGNRPVKIKRAEIEARSVTEEHQPLKLEHALGVSSKPIARQLQKGGAMRKPPSWKSKPKKGMPW